MLELLVGAVAALILLVFVAAASLVVLRVRSQASQPAGRWPFSLRRPLSEPEQVLYHRLCRALPDCMVLAQVSLSRFLAVRRGHDARAWQNRINRMSIDFLVCRQDASVIAAIELDDASHHRPDRINADEKKERALNGAGVRLLRFNVAALPDETALRRALAAETPDPRRITAAEQPADTGTCRTA